MATQDPVTSGGYGQQYRHVNPQHLNPIHGHATPPGITPPATGVYDQLPFQDPPMKQAMYRPPKDKEPALRHQWAWSTGWFKSTQFNYEGLYGQPCNLAATRSGQHRMRAHPAHTPGPLIKYPKQYKEVGSTMY